MLIRPVDKDDSTMWDEMRCALWPDHEPGEHAAEIEKYFQGVAIEPLEVLIALDDSGTAIGFAELSIRNIADSCCSGKVAYLEGWYVKDAERRKGIGTALVRASENWGRSQGCTEFASDAEIENENSIALHKQLGFEEVGRVVNFRKDL